MRIGKFPMLTKEEEANASIETLVLSHGRLVLQFARKYAKYGVDQDDLIQEGNIGLLIAAEKFDRGAGVRFSTYAQFWIRSRMRYYIVSTSRAVRVPVSAKKMKSFFSSQIPCDISMNSPLGDGFEFGDTIPSSHPRPDEIVEEVIDGERASDAVRLAIESLKPRYADVVNSRFMGEETLEDVGRRLGVSRERVRQIETLALNEIRRMMAP